MPIVEVPLAPKGEDDIWKNYHKTGHSTLLRRFALRSGDAGPGRQDIREAALAVQEWLKAARDQGIPVRPVGGAWSPSNIQTVQQGWMLNTRRFNRCLSLAAADLAQPVDPAAFMLVEGGVQIDEINDKLESDAMARSLRSTGASNGQTLAGACATGTHGSVLEAGGIQDHIRAIQIVTPGGIHWIEPKSGLMSDAFIAATGSTAWRDDDAFKAALVAVGSLGIVTAVVIQTVPRYLVRPYLKLIDFSRDDLVTLEQGDFLAFSQKHGPAQAPNGQPYFVMVVANPHGPFKHRATVRFLYQVPWQPGHQPVKDHGKLGAGYDSLTMLAWVMHNFPWAPGPLLQFIMRQAVGKGITEPIYGTWGETTETHKPLANIFTGALFCNRVDLARAFQTACDAFTGAGGSTAVTLRFMKGGHGLLSPARWPDTVGIDFDGPGGRPSQKAYLAIADALDAAGIPFTRHWGKFNGLNASRVRADYDADFTTWKGVQDQLLPPGPDRRLFASKELDELGLTT